ncbi:MAG: exopolysaccharide biosynthesis polyprenyl glycosylphosphotransferase [Lentisphaerae bacterium]|nr:exopolysaccharide biosynthesis polyprenyl glycosylphosphotransferase [Lentisphaerota bacterium]
MKLFASGRLRSFLLLFTDVLFLALAIFLVFFIYKKCGALYEMPIIFRTWPIFLLLIMFNIIGRLYCGNLLYPGMALNPVEELRRLTLSCIGSFLVFMAILTLTRGNLSFSRVALSISALAGALLLPVGRIILRYILWKLQIAKIPALIMGDGNLVSPVIEKIREDNFCILEIKGSCCGMPMAKDIPDFAPDEFLDFARKERINYLIFCNSGNEYSRDIDRYLPDFLHVLVVNQTSRFPVLWSYPVSFYRYFSFEISNRLLRKGILLQKRILEIILAVIGLILAFIPGLILALLVKLSSHGPVFYRAKRLGKNGVPIEVLKFRTMNKNADRQLEKMLAENPDLKQQWEKNFKLDNDPRITPVGRFLRRTSLDELPQFWNVIKGEMALIGPRPIVQKEVAYYGDDYKIFSSVKPGITGLWQVSGRSDVDYEDRVALDVFYVNNWSIWMDYYIFLATINAVLFRRGAR